MRLRGREIGCKCGSCGALHDMALGQPRRAATGMQCPRTRAGHSRVLHYCDQKTPARFGADKGRESGATFP
jgi:hypothetical protein